MMANFLSHRANEVVSRIIKNEQILLPIISDGMVALNDAFFSTFKIFLSFGSDLSSLHLDSFLFLFLMILLMDVFICCNSE